MNQVQMQLRNYFLKIVMHGITTFKKFPLDSQAWWHMLLNSITWETKAGGFKVQGQLNYCSETLSQNKKG
jgi:hypothetical protein